MKAGRKTIMTDDKIRIAIKLAGEGKSLTYICKFLDTNRMTFHNWCEKYPELKQRIEEEKRLAELREIESVRKALVKRAKGYKTKELKERFDENGKLLGYDLTTKEVPADVKAQQFYLINKDSENWKLNPNENIMTDDDAEGINITIDD